MKKTLFIIFAFALFIGGCSTVNLIYRNADWYLEHKINDYTSFNSRQKDTIRKDVSVYMHWHRTKALPEYIIFLQNLNGAAQYDGRLRVEEIARLRKQLSDLYKQTMVPAINPAAQLLSELDSQQIRELSLTFAKQITKQKKDYLIDGQTENMDKRAERTLDFLGWLAGDLSDEQKQKVTEASRKVPVASLSYIQHREANQARLIALLKDHAGAEKIASFMSSWIITPEATRTPQQQRAIRSFETGTDEMIAMIHGLLTARQKEHIGNLISSYIQEMQKFPAGAQAANEPAGEIPNR